MAHHKLERFAELNEMKNVLQFPAGMKGAWAKFFRNENPITLELACGKGEYAVGLASLYPDRNFIGVDLKGNRIWVGAKKATAQGLTNVGFLRTQIDQLTDYFSPNEVETIWITFPDPQLRMSKAKKRLTHPKFLRLYDQLLIPGGFIHLKTDSTALYEFTKLVISMYGCTLYDDNTDAVSLYGQQAELSIKTHYESLDIAGSSRIYYLRFSLPSSFPGREMDDLLKQTLKQNEGIH